jgi:hypothetical protein
MLSSPRGGYGKRAKTSGRKSRGEPAGPDTQDESREQNESKTMPTSLIVRTKL